MYVYIFQVNVISAQLRSIVGIAKVMCEEWALQFLKKIGQKTFRSLEIPLHIQYIITYIQPKI